MNALGLQIVADLHDCDAALLDDVSHVRQSMMEAARQGGATVVADCFHHFSPHGVSGVVVIAESHFAIHTWPEHGFAAVDLFTCGQTVRSDVAIGHLAMALGCARREVSTISRGQRREPWAVAVAVAEAGSGGVPSRRLK